MAPSSLLKITDTICQPTPNGRRPLAVLITMVLASTKSIRGATLSLASTRIIQAAVTHFLVGEHPWVTTTVHSSRPGRTWRLVTGCMTLPATWPNGRGRASFKATLIHQQNPQQAESIHSTSQVTGHFAAAALALGLMALDAFCEAQLRSIPPPPASGLLAAHLRKQNISSL